MSDRGSRQGGNRQSGNCPDPCMSRKTLHLQHQGVSTGQVSIGEVQRCIGFVLEVVGLGDLHQRLGHAVCIHAAHTVGLGVVGDHVAIDRQFIKEFYYVNGCLYGDNISVCQVQACALPHAGWQPRIDPCTGEIQRQGRFAVECPQGCGPFRHGMVLNYAAGGNGRNPSRRVWDQVVKLDDNHLLGRATIRVGFVKIPVAFFVLERISMSPVEAVPTPVEVPVLQISAPQ